MIKRLKALFSKTDDATSVTFDDASLSLASAALLVEAAVMDGNFDDAERTTVLNLLKTRFDLSDAEAAELLDDAEQTIASTHELYTFSRTVKEQTDHAGRIELIEMLWQVTYADGVLDDYEANLMRRMTGLLYITDRESAEARKRAISKIEAQK